MLQIGSSLLFEPRPLPKSALFNVKGRLKLSKDKRHGTWCLMDEQLGIAFDSFHRAAQCCIEIARERSWYPGYLLIRENALRLNNSSTY